MDENVDLGFDLWLRASWYLSNKIRNYISQFAKNNLTPHSFSEVPVKKNKQMYDVSQVIQDFFKESASIYLVVKVVHVQKGRN